MSRAREGIVTRWLPGGLPCGTQDSSQRGLAFASPESGLARFSHMATGVEGTRQFKPALLEVGTQGDTLPGEGLGHGRVFSAIEIETGHQLQGHGVLRIAQQGVVQMFTGLVGPSLPHGQAGEVAVDEAAARAALLKY